MRPVLLTAALCVAFAEGAAASPITFNTALPVHEGGFLFRGQGVYMSLHDDPSALGRKMDVWAVPSVLVYGATSKLALIGVIPWVDKDLRVTSMGVERQAAGLGDAMTLARYQIFERDEPGHTLRGDVFGGLKWPTGSSHLSDNLGLLPAVVQPGSGSYDPIVGSVWTAQWLWIQLDADIQYQRSTWANDFKFGDTLTEDVSVQYRVWPRKLEPQGVPSYLYAVLEGNSIWQAKNLVSGTADPDSGGYQLFISPGLQWVSRRFVLEVASQLPAVQSLNGANLRTDYRIVGGFRVWY